MAGDQKQLCNNLQQFSPFKFRLDSWLLQQNKNGRIYLHQKLCTLTCAFDRTLNMIDSFYLYLPKLT